MAWTTTLTEQLRYYLNDADSVTYSDARLSKFIAFAAGAVFTRLNLTSTYTVDTSVPTISPDPSSNLGISGLLVLEAAVIVIRNEIKQLAITAGYSVKDDKSSIDGKAALQAMKDLLKSFEDKLADAEFDYVYGQGTIARAVMSPYTSG